jgi:galactosamine-6-phosphate isomerase
MSSSAKHEQLAAGFRLHIAETPDEAAAEAARLLAAELRAKPDLLLCAATGATPTRAYELFAARRRYQPPLFNSLRLVKLDEWGQLPMDDPGSCETYLQRHLVQPLEISPSRYLSFQSQANPESECARITQALDEAGPIDVCVLGLGVNGHIGFNEPAESLQGAPHRSKLASSSLRHEMLRDVKVPISYGLTLGMSHLLQSRKILLLVTGSHKVAAMKQLLSRRISSYFPASFLWLHSDVTCICDGAALSVR